MLVLCGKSTVRSFLGNNILDISRCKIYIYNFSFMPIWKFKKEEDNHPAFKAISAKCAGQNSKHKHAAWGVNSKTKKFATSEETAYPMGLAKMIANCFVVALQSRGVTMPEQSMLEVGDLSLRYLQKLRATAGVQPRASRIPPLVPTFKKKLQMKVDTTTSSFKLFQKASKTISDDLPKGSKLLAISPLPSTAIGGDDKAVEMECAGQGNEEIGNEEIVQTWGIPWTPQEFVKQAARAKHPMQLDQLLPKRLREVIVVYKKSSVQERIIQRTSRLGFWVNRAKELSTAEVEFHASLHPNVASVLKGKRLLLLKEMINSINYEDVAVFDEFTQGSMLVGSSQVSGLWPLKFTPATMTLTELAVNSQKERGMLEQHRPLVDQDDELLRSVWSQTMDETETGALVGPIKLQEVDQSTPLSRRFGIRQGGKIRCVDDFSRSGVNACCSTSESPKPHTVDVIAALCMSLSSVSSDTPWVARSFDLKQAYRQCAVHPESEEFAHIVVYCPDTKQNMVFKMRALPFGSVKSVHAFLRMSSCLFAIAAAEFAIPVTSYFDDFITVCERDEVKSVSGCMCGLFKLLGWRFAEQGDKAKPFADTVAALGVTFNVSSLHRGLVTIDNTAHRKNEICSAIENIRRMQFATGQIFGRLARKAVITSHAYGSSTSQLSADMVKSLVLCKKLLGVDVPRELRIGSDRSFFVFTDASFEPDHPSWQAGLGAVLCSREGHIIQYFSVHADAALREKLNVSRKKTIIFELEFFTIWCALHNWSKWFRDSQVVLYTDNDGVRDCLIACQTDSMNGRQILDACLRAEFELRGNFWFARVPTDSNIADWPSRNELEFFTDMHCDRAVFDPQTYFDAMVVYNDVGEA